MGRYCYISQILPGKTEIVRDMLRNRTLNAGPAIQTNFWQHLGMTGFESWLQTTAQGDYLIHCLEGDSLPKIFKSLRELIAQRNPFALKLQNFYQNVLGQDYSAPGADPHIESMLDIALPSSEKTIKRAFFYPLLPNKEEAHRQFRNESMGKKKKRHEESMSAFGVSRLSTWLQSTPNGKYIVVYSERHASTPATPNARLNQGSGSSAWQEIAAHLCDHTGLSPSQLSPDSLWLNQPSN